MLAYGVFYDWSDLVPGTSYLADNHDHVWRQAGNEWCDPSSEILCHLLQCIDCFAVTLISESQQVIETDRLAGGHCAATAASGTGLRVVANRGGVGGVHFPTAAVTATALEPIGDESSMAEFPRGTGRALDQLMVQYQAAAN